MNVVAAEFAAPARIVRPAVRMDFYAAIHKALRLFMTDTLVRVGRIDVADAADRDEALTQLEQLLSFCFSHINHENDFVHTAIEARQPAGSMRIAGEHLEHREAIAALRDEASALRRAPAEAAAALALRLYRQLALFVSENFEHMHVEETVHNALLWQHYSDEELEALHGRLLASLAPEMHLLVARWMLPALAPMERAGVVADMKASMPPEALLHVLAMVKPHMDGAGWLKLAANAGISPTAGA